MGGCWMRAHERAGADKRSRQHDEGSSSRNGGESLEKEDAAQTCHKPWKHGCCDGVRSLRRVERCRREQDDGPDACAGVAYGKANMPRSQPRYVRIYQWSPSRTRSPYYRITSTFPPKIQPSWLMRVVRQFGISDFSTTKALRMRLCPTPGIRRLFVRRFGFNHCGWCAFCLSTAQCPHRISATMRPAQAGGVTFVRLV